MPKPRHKEHDARERALLHTRDNSLHDAMVKNVVALTIGGKWLAFDTLTRAKVILMPQYHDRIYINPFDLEKRLPRAEYKALQERFESTDPTDVFEQLRTEAHNPYQMAARAIEMDRSGTRRMLKRTARRLKYRFNFDRTDPKHVEQYSRLCPQAASIVDIMEIAVQGRTEPVFDEQEMKDIIWEHRDMLNTRQEPWRIFQYYRGNLLAAGFLRYAK